MNTLSRDRKERSKSLKKRLLIYGDENCGLIRNLARGFREMENFEVTTAICQEDPLFTNFKYDYNFERPQRRKGNRYLTKFIHLAEIILWKVKFFNFEVFKYYRYDMYIFTWQTLMKEYEDLKILNRKNKKVVFLYIGSNVRWIEAFKQEFPDNPYKGLANEDWLQKILLIRMGELYASSIFSVPDQSSLFIRGYFHMFMPVDISSIKFTPQCREVPLIIHAPSKRDVKGTGLILHTIEQLRDEGIKFEFLLLENMNNQTVLRKLEEADILVDQLYLHGPATLSTEALAAGCAVAARYFKQYDLTKDAPVFYVDETNIRTALKELILNIELRKDLISKGLHYVEKHNSIGSICNCILDSIDRDAVGDYDYKPDFFRRHFVLPERYCYPEQIQKLNQMVLNKYT